MNGKGDPNLRQGWGTAGDLAGVSLGLEDGPPDAMGII
jgi:hypothetical protein